MRIDGQCPHVIQTIGMVNLNSFRGIPFDYFDGNVLFDKINILGDPIVSETSDTG